MKLILKEDWISFWFLSERIFQEIKPFVESLVVLVYFFILILNTCCGPFVESLVVFVYFFILTLNTCCGPEEKFFWYWQKPWGSGGIRLVSNLNIAQSSVECVDRIPKIATPAVHWLLLFQDTKTHSPSIAHITFLWSDIEEISISTQSHKLTLIFRAQSGFEMFTRDALEARVSKPTPVTLITAHYGLCFLG